MLALVLSLTIITYALGAFDCSKKSDCFSCVQTKSWSGDPCRWCPVDQKCHAKGSLLNDCENWQNIVAEEWCESTPYARVCLNGLAPSQGSTIFIVKSQVFVQGQMDAQVYRTNRMGWAFRNAAILMTTAIKRATQKSESNWSEFIS